VTFSLSIQERELDLQLPPADTVSFIPVYLRRMDGAVLEANPCDPLALSPAPFPVPPTQPRQLANLPTGGYGFDTPYGADDFEVHQRKLSRAQPTDGRHPARRMAWRAADAPGSGYLKLRSSRVSLSNPLWERRPLVPKWNQNERTRW